MVSHKKILLAGLLIMATVILSCSKSKITGPYFLQVKTIIEENCVSCHYQGGQGMPVILTSDSDIVLHAEGIKAATCDPWNPIIKHMPPDKELSDQDKEIITKWFEGGGTTAD